MTSHQLDAKGTIWVELPNPTRGNAINEQLVELLEQVLNVVESDLSVFAVVLSAGEGDHFCAGGDLALFKDFDQQQATSFAERVWSVCERILCSPALWVAMLRGAVFGGGAELALACDVRFAGPRTQFKFSQASMGLCGGWGGIGRLVNRLGRQSALDLILRGETLNAEALVQSGLALAEVDDEGDLATWTAYREQFLTNDPNVLRANIEIVKLKGERRVEREAFQRLWKRPSHVEGLRNFFERRNRK